jgi:DNA repair exonuclease SbcCD ATPase subunit
MRKIEFKKIYMENYTLFIDPMELQFNGNLLLITGPNGTGKTSMFDCIPYTLYGVTSKGHHGDDVLNDIVKKNCFTSVDFTLDEIPYRVERYHKHSSKGSNVFLYKDNQDKPYKVGHTDVVKEIENLILHKNLFMNMLYFGQKVKDFFTNLTDSKKEEIFRKILDLQIFGEWYKEADKRIKDIDNSIVEIQKNRESSIQVLNNVNQDIIRFDQEKQEFEEEKKKIIDILEKEIHNNKYKIQASNEDLEKAKNELQEVVGRLEKIADVSNSMQRLDEKLISFKSEIDRKRLEKESELKEKRREEGDLFQKEIKIKKEEIVKIYENSSKELIDKQNELTRQMNEIKSKENIIENNISHIIKDRDNILHDVMEKDISVCPTCRQKIDDSTKVYLKQEVDKLNIQILNLNHDVQNLHHEYDSIKGSYDEITKVFNSKLEDLNNQKEQLSQDESSTISKLDIKLSNVLNELNEKAKFHYTQYQNEIDIEKEKLRNDKNKYDELLQLKVNNEKKVQDVVDLIQNLKSTIDVNNKLIEEKKLSKYNDSSLQLSYKRKNELSILIDGYDKTLIEKERKKKINSFWKSGFSSTGIPAILIDDAIPFMNERVKSYLELLSNGRYLLSFDSVKATKSKEYRDKVGVNVFDHETKADNITKLSGGQMRLIDIATILTLHDLYSHFHDVSFNILLFDEVFDSLDSQNSAFVSSLLRRLIGDKTVAVVSHVLIDSLEYDEHLEFH